MARVSVVVYVRVLRVLWEEILPRFERIEVVEEPSRTFSSFVNGYTRLPVVVRRK